jgi:hypothetical protein
MLHSMVLKNPGVIKIRPSSLECFKSSKYFPSDRKVLAVINCHFSVNVSCSHTLLIRQIGLQIPIIVSNILYMEQLG